MSDDDSLKKYNQSYTTPKPDEYVSYQRSIYASLRAPPYPTSFAGWETAARQKLPAANFGYVNGNASGGRTCAFNVSAFDRYRIRPRMLVNATRRETSVELFGHKYDSPLLLCPVGVQGIIHNDAEMATARAAKAVGVPYVHSSAASRSLEETAEANSTGDRWYQLYWPRPQSEDLTASVLSRAKANGYQVLVVTLDTFNLAWRPTDLDTSYLPFVWGQGNALGFTDPVFKAQFQEQLNQDSRSLPEKLSELWSTMMRPGTPYGALRVLLNVQNIMRSSAWLAIGQSGTYREWSHLAILRDLWDGPIVLKGIQTVEDAQKAAEYGMDGIWISNHGGRQCDGAIASLDALAEIGADEAVKKSGMRLIFDSGVRTGSDVLKALALGAHAVGIGRPFVYGLALGGQAGVEHVLRCMLADMDGTLGNMGKTSVHELSRGDLKIVDFESRL